MLDTPSCLPFVAISDTKPGRRWTNAAVSWRLPLAPLMPLAAPGSGQTLTLMLLGGGTSPGLKSDPGFLGVSCVFYAKWGCSVCGTFHYFKRLNQPTIFDINCDFSEKQGLLRFNSERARETRKPATQKTKPLHISYLYKCLETRFPNKKLLPNADEISIFRP